MVGWLERQKFLSHTLRGWEVPDPGGSKAGFVLRPLLACGQLPSPCAHMASCARAGGGSMCELSGVSYKGTDAIRLGPHPHDLI